MYSSFLKGFILILIGNVCGTPTSSIEKVGVNPDEYQCFEGEGLFPYPEPKECYKFYSCAIQGFKGEMKTCPSGELFDSLDRICKPKAIAQCEIVPCSQDGRIAEDKINPNSYFICENNQAKRVKCDPPGTLFDPIEGSCNRPMKIPYHFKNEVSGKDGLKGEKDESSGSKVNVKTLDGHMPQVKYYTEQEVDIEKAKKRNFEVKKTIETPPDSSSVNDGHRSRGSNLASYIILGISLFGLFFFIGGFYIFAKYYMGPQYKAEIPSFPTPSTSPPTAVLESISQIQKDEKEEKGGHSNFGYLEGGEGQGSTSKDPFKLPPVQYMSTGYSGPSVRIH